MARVISNGVITNTCGVGLFAVFRNDNDGVDCYQQYPKIKSASNHGGAGWLLAGFTNELPAYKEAYEELCERWGAPVFQSPVRRNNRSGHMFFFAIWDTRKKK